MTTAWILVMFLTYDRSASISTIENLASVAECKRVEEVIRSWRNYSNLSTKCIEVIRK